jgi:hypothetical protein
MRGFGQKRLERPGHLYTTLCAQKKGTRVVLWEAKLMIPAPAFLVLLQTGQADIEVK